MISRAPYVAKAVSHGRWVSLVKPAPADGHRKGPYPVLSPAPSIEGVAWVETDAPNPEASLYKALPKLCAACLRPLTSAEECCSVCNPPPSPPAPPVEPSLRSLARDLLVAALRRATNWLNQEKS